MTANDLTPEQVADWTKAMILKDKILIEMGELCALSGTIAMGTAHLAVLQTEMAIVATVRKTLEKKEVKA